MEFYSPKLKKIIIFFQKKHFFNISGGNFLSSKNNLYLKKFVMFFQKKVFLIFQEMELHGPVFFLKKFFLMFQEGTSEARKTKNLFFFRFWGMVLSSPKSKNFLIFLFLIFFIRTFFIRIFFSRIIRTIFIRIIRQNFYIISNKLGRSFFNKTFTFF